MDILIFILVLSVLIVVHEYGHFIVAKKCGVKVEKFSVGFGPKLVSKVIDDTEFMICAIPLGGYVKMAGDDRSQCKGDPKEFFSQPIGHRALIVVMGPVVNYVLAYLCFVVVFMIGFPMTPPKVGEVIAGYPAEVAGFKAGDRIVQIDGQKVEDWEDLQRLITKTSKDSLEINLERDGKQLTQLLTPRVEELRNIFGQKENMKIIGIRPADEVVNVKYPLSESFTRAGQELWKITEIICQALYRMFTGAMNPKDAMSGPVGIFMVVKKAADLGFNYLLLIVASISANLAIFNLLPLPILDGGHLLFLAIEKIRGRALSEKVDLVINRIGLVFILSLALFAFYVDLEKIQVFSKISEFWKSIKG